MKGNDPVQVKITRRYAAAAERVFDAWVDPAWICRWMFGPAVRDEEVLRLSVDARVGGKFSFLVRRGELELDHVGTYLELERPWRLAFTWGVGEEAGETSQVYIVITPLENGCELTLVHKMAPQWAEYASRTEAGWSRMLGTLASALAPAV